MPLRDIRLIAINLGLREAFGDDGLYYPIVGMIDGRGEATTDPKAAEHFVVKMGKREFWRIPCSNYGATRH